jgi:hypothetical protein
MKAAIALPILLFGANEVASNGLLPREVARFILVLLPILAGATICVLILYDDHISNKQPQAEPIGWTRPEHLLNTDSGPTENRNNSDELSQPPSLQPALSRVVCRYCGREIAHGRYCSDCHLTSGYAVKRSQ